MIYEYAHVFCEFYILQKIQCDGKTISYFCHACSMRMFIAIIKIYCFQPSAADSHQVPDSNFVLKLCQSLLNLLTPFGHYCVFNGQLNYV